MSIPEAPPSEGMKGVWYRDAFGHWQSVWVKSDDARKINNVLRAARRLDQKWRERHETFTDADIFADQVAKQDRPREDLGNAWDGPRFSFTLFLGMSVIWSGDPATFVRGKRTCKICKGRYLESGSYCTGCDRSSVDNLIPPVPASMKPKVPSKREKARAEKEARLGLKGGLAGKK